MTALVAALTLTLAAPQDTLEVFEIDSLAPGVWAATVIPRPDAYAFANSLVVAGEAAVLVVDAQASPSASKVLVDIVRGLTDLPVRWVVNTHWHGDHVYGNQAWAEAFPGVRFVGHREARAAVLAEGAEQLREELEGLPASIEERRGWLESGTGPDGSALGEEDRESVRYSLRLREAYLADLRGLRHIAPDTTFESSLDLDLGGRMVHVRHFGPAHTAGDAVVIVPDVGVVAAGDLLEEAPPWIEGAWLPGWARTLRTMRDMSPRVILPAHGGVQRGDRLLRDQASLLTTVVATARQARREGWSVEAATESAELDPHRESMARLGVSAEAFDAWWAEALALAMEQISGGG